MESVVFLDLTSKQLTDTLGGSRWNFPTLTYGEDITLGLRFARREAGTISEVSRDVVELRASIGRIDARPESGKWGFEIVDGSGDTIDDLSVNVKASELATQINALTLDAGLGTATVEEKSGSYLIRFSGETVADYDTPVAFVPSVTNSLFPVSFIRHRTSQEDGKWVHELRLIQAPVASTSLSSRIQPPPPTISTVQNGGEDEGSGAVWNEIQDLYLPPTFRGTYQIKRGYKRTSLLDLADGVNQIAEALTALADDGGVFNVTNPTADHAHIEFAGTMGGTNQDALEVVVFSAPEGDLTFNLNLATAELNALLRRDAEIVLPIEISATITDENDDEVEHERTLYSGEVTIRRQLHWDELATAANIDWLRPPLNEVYGGFNYTQVSNGQLHHAAAYGNGSATSFVINHNLDAADTTVIVKDASSGALLTQGTDYSVTVTNSNSLTVTSLVGAPTTNDWRIVVLGLAETSYFDPHTHAIADILLLQGILDDLGGRLEDLEARAGVGALPVRSASDIGIAAQWQLPEIFEVYPTREAVEEPAGRLVDLDTSKLGRTQGLLAAVHDATVEALPTTIPTPSSTHVGRVFQNQTGGDILLPGGKGHRSVTLKADEYAACDGRVWYQVVKYSTDESSFYPKAFERTLFTVHVSERQLRLRKQFEVRFAMELAVLASNTSAFWSLVIEVGERTEASTPGTPGENLAAITWRAVPLLEEPITIGPVSAIHQFGMRIERALVSAVDTLTATGLIYGDEIGDIDPPDSANFALRARLIRFDTEDNQSDPKGFAVLRGLSLASQGVVNHGAAEVS